jgi:hypothetical protein
VPFGIIYSFEFHRYKVLKIKIKADRSVDMILPHAVANNKGIAYLAIENKKSSLEHSG